MSTSRQRREYKRTKASVQADKSVSTSKQRREYKQTKEAGQGVTGGVVDKGAAERSLEVDVESVTLETIDLHPRHAPRVLTHLRGGAW